MKQNQPRVLLRAVACGIPVIASLACGLNNVCGVVSIATGDKQALLDAIEMQITVGALSHGQREAIAICRQM